MLDKKPQGSHHCNIFLIINFLLQYQQVTDNTTCCQIAKCLTPGTLQVLTCINFPHKLKTTGLSHTICVKEPTVPWGQKEQ